MGMYADLLINATEMIHKNIDPNSLPSYIGSDTEKIYGMIEVMGLKDYMNHYQLERMSDWRQDIGSVPVPQYYYELDDDAILGLASSIDIPLTSTDELYEWIKFIRDNEVSAIHFG